MTLIYRTKEMSARERGPKLLVTFKQHSILDEAVILADLMILFAALFLSVASCSVHQSPSGVIEG